MNGEFRTFDPADANERAIYFQMTAIVAPRPIAWISTLAPDGTMNIGPFSFTTILSSEPPPIVCFVTTGTKHSLLNAQEQGDFVYNVGGEEMFEKLVQTSAELDRDESEFEWVGLTPLASEVVKSPRIAEAAVSMECTLSDVIPFGNGTSHLVAGEVVRLHVADRVFSGDRIDPLKIRQIGRLSGSNYTTFGEILTMQRPGRQGLVDLGMQPLAES